MSQAPAISFNAIINGEHREIFMSFALLNRVSFLVGNMENLHEVMLNPEMREAILVEMLAERTQSGKLVKQYALDEVVISNQDVMNLLDFVGEHLLDFFMGALKKSQALQLKHLPTASSLTPTPIGQAA